MKLFCESVTVQSDDAKQPASIIWRRRHYRVQAVQEVWEWRGRWWETPTLLGYRRRYYRLLCLAPGGHPICLEVYRQRGRWTLSRVLD